MKKSNVNEIYPINNSGKSEQSPAGFVSLFDVNKTRQVMGYKDYQQCVDACANCATVCSYCAISCLKEDNVQMMAECIRMNLECAAICKAAADMMVYDSARAKDICKLCAEICDKCAAECDKHEHGHCQECAETCRRCAEECRKMAA